MMEQLRAFVEFTRTTIIEVAELLCITYKPVHRVKKTYLR